MIKNFFKLILLVGSVLLGIKVVRHWQSKEQAERKEEKRVGLNLRQKKVINLGLDDSALRKIIRAPKLQNAELSNLNQRQNKLYGVLQAKQTAEMKDFLTAVKGVTERTLRRDLLKLQQLKLVEKEGNTKSAKYHLV